MEVRQKFILMKMKTIDWNNLFKVRIANPSDTFQKHEVIKLLLVMKILNKNKRKNWIRVYTEFELENGLKPDIYFENIRDKSVIIYEVQKEWTKEWLDQKTQAYKDYEVPYMNSVDFIPVNLNECPNDLNEINKWLDKFIF